MKEMRFVVALVILHFSVGFVWARAEADGGFQLTCSRWDNEVASNDTKAGSVDIATISDKEVLQAIDCLLRHKGDQRPARFGGATRLDTSQLLPSATVELASLYYISYVFTKHWKHGDGVALWNKEGVINPPGSIDAAYVAYTKWFARVRSLGITAARRKKLDPLQGSRLKWYGN
jgi:hypothetical protein